MVSFALFHSILSSIVTFSAMGVETTILTLVGFFWGLKFNFFPNKDRFLLGPGLNVLW